METEGNPWKSIGIKKTKGNQRKQKETKGNQWKPTETKGNRKELREAGFSTLPHWGWGVFLPPVYLWKRSTMFQQSRETFWVWSGSVIAYALLT